LRRLYQVDRLIPSASHGLRRFAPSKPPEPAPRIKASLTWWFFRLRRRLGLVRKPNFQKLHRLL